MQSHLFSDRERLAQFFRGKRVALVGSGPGVMDNAPGFIDSHEIVCRVNNYKLGDAPGWRTDVHYSFYGSSIRKTAEELHREGVRLCINKCPNAQFMESAWHRDRNKMNGVDFRYIYEARKDFWFCPTFEPTMHDFMVNFHLLGDHIPTTGFAALVDLVEFQPASLYVSGMDFFASGIHNVNEQWRPGDPTDPIGHVPHLERRWLADNFGLHNITLDPVLDEIIEREKRNGNGDSRA